MDFPVTFPCVWPSLAIKVYVNWSGTDFAGEFDEITDDVIELNWHRGFDKELGHNTGGTCDITLKDPTSKYSSENTDSDFYGTTLLGKEIKVCTSTHDLFYGYINRVVPHPRKDDQRSYISAVDGTDRLARNKIYADMYTDTASGAILDVILDAVDWPAGRRTLDTGVDTLPYWYANGESALQIIQDIEDLELSRFWVDGAGYARWEDRHHRLKTPHDASQFTIDNTMVDIIPDLNLLNLINRATISVTPKAEGASLTDVFTLGYVPEIQPGDTYVFDVVLDVPTNNSVSYILVANTDPYGTGNTITDDIDVSADSGGGAMRWTISLENTGEVLAYITSFVLYGYAIEDQPQVIAEDSDATSQSDYGGIYPYDLGCMYEQSLTLAQGRAEYLISKFKDPVLTYAVKLKNKNDTIWDIMLSGDISDRVTLKSTILGTNRDGHIRSIDHHVSANGKVHECTWELEPAETDKYWILDDETYSVLGSTTKLAF